MTKQLVIEMPEYLHTKIKIHCAKNKITIKKFVIDCINEGLK